MGHITDGSAARNKTVSFIRGIADDVLRDLFVRGKYCDVILPMCVLRQLDAVLEPTKQRVPDTKKMLDDAGITEQRLALCAAPGQTYAIRKADMPARGEAENADHIVGGAEWSTLSLRINQTALLN